MPENASSLLTPWSNFYVMTGSSAAALTGLMFVVISLSTGSRRTTHDGVSTFNTPTVVHFCAALVISAVLSVPWRSFLPPAILLGLGGLFGVAYVLVLAHRARQLRMYTPDLEDWVCYTVLPLISYGAVLAGAIFLPAAPGEALFAFGGAALLLVLLGIRNAWDVVTFITMRQSGTLTST